VALGKKFLALDSDAAGLALVGALAGITLVLGELHSSYHLETKDTGDKEEGAD
jgi:hypothetical protein